MAREAGLEVRTVVCKGIDHVWAEVKVNGSWIIVEPANVVHRDNRSGYNISAESYERVHAKRTKNISYIFAECPDGYMDDYHFRNRIENNHGTEKRKTEIKNIEAKSIKRITTHIGMHLIALHAIALCRLQNGITTGLTNLAGLV